LRSSPRWSRPARRERREPVRDARGDRRRVRQDEPRGARSPPPALFLPRQPEGEAVRPRALRRERRLRDHHAPVPEEGLAGPTGRSRPRPGEGDAARPALPRLAIPRQLDEDRGELSGIWSAERFGRAPEVEPGHSANRTLDS